MAVNLLVWEWVYSLNHITILCIKVGKIDFLGKNTFLGQKFIEGKMPNIGITNLVKKKNPASFTSAFVKKSSEIFSVLSSSKFFLKS